MKRYFKFLLVIPLALLLMGGSCEDEPTEALDGPDVYTLEADINGIDLKIDWDSSTDEVDGYRIYFNGDTAPLYEGTASEYTHVNPSLGSYEIVAYFESDESDPLEFNTSNYVTSGTSAEIWRFDVSGQPSGYGWNLSTGNGEHYNFTAGNADYIDIYYTNMGEDYHSIASASYYGGSFENVTWINKTSTSFDNLDTAPATPTGYYNYEDVEINGTYALCIEKTGSDSYFGKMQVTAFDTDNNKVTFRWKFQKVKGWRVFE
ncbi:hypothetical protein DRQ36_00855 [bacterium]|nr:MAG: hypothetical protein DRQ36_00855 [bacterium]